MHIPDGGITHGPGALLAAGAGLVSLAAGGWALARARASLGEKRVPLLGVTAAFVFAAQMLNFPVAAGTSGHFLGATLAAALLGPWEAVLVLALVLLVQCFGFADGGVTALGLNVLNMGLIGGLGGWIVMRGLLALLPRRRAAVLAAAAVAAGLVVPLAAAACAVELHVAGLVPLGLALKVMVGVHLLIGLGEALITAAALGVVLTARPDLVRLAQAAGLAGTLPPPQLEPLASEAAASGAPSGRTRLAGPGALLLAALGVSLLLAGLASPFASARPDGLEWVAEERGFAETLAGEPVFARAPLPEYATPGVAGGWGTGLAGVLGTAAVFVLGFVLIRLVTGTARPHEEPAPAAGIPAAPADGPPAPPPSGP